MGILSGLKNMGVDLKKEDMFENNKPKTAPKPKPQPVVKASNVENEEDFVLARTFTCPICESSFKSLKVKSNRARLVGTDIDLRPVHAPLDTLKYAVTSCPVCGYSALQRNFDSVTSKQRKLIQEKRIRGFERDPLWEDKTIYTYDEAIMQYELALQAAVTKEAKSSEKAYLCLMMAWIVRGKKDTLKETDPNYKKTYDDCVSAEAELIQSACDGFIDARATETYPMVGYDQYTMDYLLSALLYECGKYEDSVKILGELITSNGTNSRIKDRARTLKEMVFAKLSEKNQ